jgi:hypothetical protein
MLLRRPKLIKVDVTKTQNLVVGRDCHSGKQESAKVKGELVLPSVCDDPSKVPVPSDH